MIPSSYDWNRYTIQDPVHGSIRYGPIEKLIIDHPLFQRLHGLRQNSLLYLVFPSANHTRFDHSVGVMHLAGQFLDSILKNQRTILEKGEKRRVREVDYRVDDRRIKKTVKRLEGDAYPKLVVRVAALLHDTGHGPFSHLFDRFFPSISFVKNLIGNSSPVYRSIARALVRISTTRELQHEMMSCLIATYMANDIGGDLRNLGIEPPLLAKDVCAVIDSRLRPSNKLSETNSYNVSRLLHEVISSSIDADRMDYLLRDSRMCGVNYGLYDPDRILKSLCMYEDGPTGLAHIGIRYSGLGALEDLLISRYQMHSQIYGHKTNRACAVMLDEIHDRLKGSGWNWYESCSTIDDLLETFWNLTDSSLVEKIRRERDTQVGALLRQLMERKLVKRTFEERVPKSGKGSKQGAEARGRWREHRERMREKDIPFMEDRFEIKGLGLNHRKETLKVLRKHPQEGYYLVHELSEFSALVKYLPSKEVIYRNYCFAPQVSSSKRLVPRNARPRGAPVPKET